MREFASLLLAAALAAPFGDAGALSLAGTAGCPTDAVAQAEASWDLQGHGLASDQAPSARPYLPAAGTASGGGGEADGPSRSSALVPEGSHPPLRPCRAPRAGTGHGAAPVAPPSLLGFDAHPSTAPPLHS